MAAPGRWLLYGAYGFTGRLIAREAVAAGERPVLAGRDQGRLAELADTLALEHVVFELGDDRRVREALAGMGAVLHAAGPFTHTWRAVAEACVATGAHYLDITGELDVIEGLRGMSAGAAAAGVALLPGAGFDVVPTDCAAALAARAVMDPTHIELAFHSTGGPSRGTARSAIEHLDMPQLELRDGRLGRMRDPSPRTIPFADRPRTAVPISWGDLGTAQHSTGVPNVRVYMTAPPNVMRLAATMRAARPLVRVPGTRALLRWVVDRTVVGPDETELVEGRSRVRALAWNEESGQEAAVELTTPNGYTLTARSAVAAVRRLLVREDGGHEAAADSAPAAGPYTGFLTPSVAFGAGFAEELEGVERVVGP